MIDYRAGTWGFHVAFGLEGSLVPRAFVMAMPNALLTFLIGSLISQASPDSEMRSDDVRDAAQTVIAAVTPIMIFILYNRSRTSYDRWWEGGTLLQKTRGEWFNAYSSIMAFTSTKPELQDQVDAYVHLLTRLMSLLMCCGLQQVSPERDRPFEIFDLDGIEPASMEFLNAAPDKVEIILQWIQRSMVLHQQTGVLPVAPPILSRAFQEVSRGIVNLQNARKIADFPYPYPLAQISMILQLLHWAATPFAAALALPKAWAVAFSFCSIFVLWCIHFNALDLEFPFGSRVNDLPMQEFQQEWNNSICTLVAKRATRPPKFEYDPVFHDALSMVMSDASELYVPKGGKDASRRKIAIIKVGQQKKDDMEEEESDDNNGIGMQSQVPGRFSMQLSTMFGIRSSLVKSASYSHGSSSAVSRPVPIKVGSGMIESTPKKIDEGEEKSGRSGAPEVNLDDIVVTTAPAPKATNDTNPSSGSTAQSSHAASDRMKVLPPVNSIQPLVLDSKTSLEVPMPDGRSSPREGPESSGRRNDSAPAQSGVADRHKSSEESRCPVGDDIDDLCVKWSSAPPFSQAI